MGNVSRQLFVTLSGEHHLGINSHSSSAGCLALKTHSEENLGEETEDTDHNQHSEPAKLRRNDEWCIGDE